MSKKEILTNHGLALWMKDNPVIAAQIFECMDIYVGEIAPLPTPSPKDQPEGQSPITIEDIQRAYCAGFINGAGENGSVIDAMADGKLKDAWERYMKSPYMPKETSSSAIQPIEWDSYHLIGRVRERFKELEAKGWNWRSFYNGWLEGRADMFAEIKGIKNHMEVFDIEEKILDELVHPLKQNFSGSNDYMSGVNDGLYTMARRLLEFQPNTSEAGMSQEDQRHIHVELPSGGVARVSPDASPELLGALDKMVELAKEMPEPTPALQGEIPEEITAAEILHKHMLGRKNSYMHDAMEEYAQYKCDLLYHKMQEEIKEYRKALGEIQGICGTITKPLHFSQHTPELISNVVKVVLVKYPQGKEGWK